MSDITADTTIIDLKHVNTGGVDYAALDGNTLKIVEAKARQSLTLANLKRYIKLNEAGTLEFNAKYLIKDIGEDYLKT